MNRQFRVIEMETGIWGKTPGQTDKLMMSSKETEPQLQAGQKRGKNRGSLAVRNKGRGCWGLRRRGTVETSRVEAGKSVQKISLESLA
ncbi:hypothetical protein AN642_00415 [Epulopiscium sp. SCG-B10WGA-EpuloA2]|nr:hypothetical protein AN642_00415 [Epulopiscium sp. SCG-B10WGA-EpuloA2]